jgi:hypothetical protein
MNTGTVRRFAGSRQADADVRRLRLARPVDDATHDSEGQGFNARVLLLPHRHLLADVLLRALGELLERRARRASTSGTGRDTRCERSQAQRLQQLAGGIDFVAAIAAGPWRQ